MKKIKFIISTRKRKKHIAILAILGVGLSLYTLKPWAKCTMQGNPSVRFADNVVVPRDMVNGQVITMVTTEIKLECNNQEFDREEDGHLWSVYVASATNDLGHSTMQGVYKTSVKGIGLRWKNYHLGKTQKIIDIMTKGPLTGASNFRGIKERGTVTFKDTFELVKIGPVTAGKLQGMIINMRQKAKQSGNHDSDFYSYKIIPTSVSVQSCRVTDKVLQVRMDTVTTKLFTQIGNTAQEKMFTINLDCDSSVPVKITLDGSTIWHNPGSGVLHPDTDSTSKGVGIQILHNSRPVFFSREIDIGKRTGLTRLPFSARYFQIGNNVSAGELKATATFTLNYK